MKRKQFNRVCGVLEELFDTYICSEGYMDSNNRHIVKWGFYPRPYMYKQVILFNTITGEYQVGMIQNDIIATYHEYSAYNIKGLRKILREIYPNLV